MSNQRKIEQLGEFLVKKQLGEGGMGAVYLGYQESLDRDVALKVLTERLCRDEKFIARFKREARSAASIVHPNVIQIYVIGEQDGVHYFAMEYVRGKDLSETLAGGTPFRVEEALDVVQQVAEALSAAGEVGIIHRDLKPANIMVTDRGLVKVTDFGLAKIAGSDMDVTEAGTIVGTANYMSPEQGQGKSLDIRSDIYSLGVVLFELLAGRVPFKADQPSAVLYMHVYEPPPPPSQFNKSVPPSVDRLVLRMMAKDPDDRPAGADALLAEIRGLRQSLGGAAVEESEPFADSSDPVINPPTALIAETPPARVDRIRALPSGTLKALVADDVPNVRRLYNKVLSRMGFDVVEAEDGQQAVKLWETEHPSLVLLDIGMPKMDGRQVLAYRAENNLGGKVIVVSGRQDDATIRQAAASNVTSYLTKPVNVNELQSRIEQVMDTPGGRLEISEAASEAKVSKDLPDTGGAGGDRQIVIFDTGPYARTLYRGILESLGHQVACVEHVGDLKRILDEDTPDLLVLSLEEDDPEMDGVLNRLRGSDNTARTLLITPEHNEELAARMKALQLGPVLAKPVRLGTFRMAVEDALKTAPSNARVTVHSDTFNRIVEQQLAHDHAYTLYDFARHLSTVLPAGARATFESRLEDGTIREVQTAVTNLLRKLKRDGKAELGMRYVRNAYMHGNLEVRNFCFALLPELLPPREEVEVLLKIITDEDFRIRQRVIERLGELQATSAVEMIVRFLNDDVWKVRKAAAACLESYPLEKVIEPLLIFYARSREPLSGTLRNRLLSGTGMKEMGLLEKLATRGSTEVRTYIADFLGQLQSKLSVRILQHLLRDRSPVVQAAAARACGRVRNDKLRDNLFGVLTSGNSEVQAAAVEALKQYPLTPATAVFLDILAKRGKRVAEDAARLLVALNQGDKAIEKALDNLAGQSEANRRYLSLLLGGLYPEAQERETLVRRLNAMARSERRGGVADVIRRIQERQRALTRGASDTDVR